MALLIQPDGHVLEVQPNNGKDFSLEELKAFLNDGWIEVCHFPQHKMRMVVDDNGHAKSLKLNVIATAIYRYCTRPNENIIVGPALLCDWDEIE